MLATMVRSEVKNLLRDKMTLIMLFYPFLLAALGKYLIESEIVQGQVMGLVAMMLILMVGVAYGATAGFSLLDDRDDQVLISIQISPVSVKLYIWLKIGLLYMLAVLATFFTIWLMDVVRLAPGEILLLSMLMAMYVPFSAFLINAFAQNKVEGFVTMKGSNFLMLLPIGSFFFLDGKEWLFAVAPGHWAAKGFQAAMLQPQIEAGLVTMNLTFYQYVGIGMAYNLLLVAAMYALFQRRQGL